MKSKAEVMYDAVTGIDERYLSEAEAHPAKTRNTWRRWAAIAANLVLVAGLGTILLLGRGPASTGGGSVGRDGYYSVYFGPVLPMTALGDLDGLLAAREVAYDFTRFEDGGYPGAALVTDRYVLRNQSEQDKTLKLCYPVSGSLADATLSSLAFRVDGAAVTPEFHIGYNVPESRNYLSSWNEYRQLLERPGHLSAALAPEAELTLPAVVYTLVEESPGTKAEEQVNLRFRVDPARTAVFASGFTMHSVNAGSGSVRVGFYIDRRESARQEPCRVVLVGGDLETPTLNDPLGGGGSWRLERRETGLAEVLEEDLAWYMQSAEPGLSHADNAAVARLLEEEGLPVLQNSTGLGATIGLLTRAHNSPRVMYESFEVTIPAGGSLTVEAKQKKTASHQLGGRNSGGSDTVGYDLVTQAGSELVFTEQTASVTGLDSVKIGDDNFGFDPEHGICAVVLNPEIPCYWMQLQSK